ncbi:radical SAM protein [Massilia sp. CF038]|uniref:radical SAM protein n=1 Tax=Massilia sp. CF038 TaxID=1881045 RepID=UPI000919C47C|nr:radical SAM protein [Massilia sp. CF038]SHH62717.1 uncharacterized protein SAMN05428948_4701 [Massilia sp. CF038]
MEVLNEMQVSPAQQEQTSLPNGFTRPQIANAITSKVQELILFPTEKCNFRCTYCYEDFELGKMSKGTQRGIERYLDHRVPQLKQLTLSWFGGEPLLAREIVLRLTRYAFDLCKKHGVALKGNITTNAYTLDSELASELIGMHLDFYQITVDGWEEGHNVLRRRADGKGTFSTIWNNLIAMKGLDQQFEVLLRVHVRRDNHESIVTLMEQFAAVFQGDTRFRLDFQHLRDLGGAGGETIIDGIKLSELPAIEARMRKVYHDALVRLGHAQVSDFPAQVQTVETQRIKGESASSRRASEQAVDEPYICYASKPNSLLIRSNGRLGKCTVALSDDRNDLGYIKEDGKIELNNAKLLPWIRGLGTLSEHAAACPLDGMAPSELKSPYPSGGKVVPIVSIPARS